jgi:ATP-dependent DNA helicase RecG
MDEALLNSLLAGKENYDLEVKTARSAFSLGKLHDYCAAIANENGGHLLLGVTNDRRVVGSNAFLGNWNTLAHTLTQALKIRIKVYEVNTAQGRVLAFEIPRHPTGIPVQVHGGTGKYRYPIRDGESIVEMGQQTLQDIFAEKEDDWSSQIAEGVDINDLDEKALKMYRTEWAKQTQRSDRKKVPFESMLSDLQLTQDGSVTNAAVLLFGTEQTLYRAVPDAEIIFEWRNSENEIAYGERRNWRQGFMIVKDEIWNAINARNTMFRYQEGFIQRDIPSFDEGSIREAVINAFAHRDYRITGRSIVIKVSPEKFYIENPGRLMPGVTLENILDKSVWRNRLLAESLEKVHVMERSSQGIDKIFRRTIESGKGLPVLEINDDPSVILVIPATLKDQSFINFLETVVKRHQVTLSSREVIELEQIRQGTKTKNLVFKDKFLGLGIIERIGQGRGSRYILSHNYYKYAEDPGQHTRLSGLTRQVKRTLVIEHLKKHKKVTNHELQTAFPDMGMQEISTLLKGMRKDKLIRHEGSPRWGHWCLIESSSKSSKESS